MKKEKEKTNEVKLIRFDWAFKRLLRHKADHTILNGFLTSLLGREIKIIEILESESNPDYDENKQNRVDLLAQESDGTKILIEVQNESEDSYFHRMLFGTSRIIADYLKRGQNYSEIKKVYSINIVYFNLGVGTDYVYKGQTKFVGLHNHEELKLPAMFQSKFKVAEISDIFPEYFILKANDFDRWSKVPLDQWMYFLSKSEIPEDADAPGLKEARQELQIVKLSPGEQESYWKYLENMNSLNNVYTSGYEEGLFDGIKEGMKQGLEEGESLGRKREKLEIAENMKKSGLDLETISRLTGIPLSEL